MTRARIEGHGDAPAARQVDPERDAVRLVGEELDDLRRGEEVGQPHAKPGLVLVADQLRRLALHLRHPSLAEGHDAGAEQAHLLGSSCGDVEAIRQTRQLHGEPVKAIVDLHSRVRVAHEGDDPHDPDDDFGVAQARNGLPHVLDRPLEVGPRSPEEQVGVQAGELRREVVEVLDPPPVAGGRGAGDCGWRGQRVAPAGRERPDEDRRRQTPGA